MRFTYPFTMLIDIFYGLYDFSKEFISILNMNFADAWYSILGDAFIAEIIERVLSIIGLSDTPLWAWLITSSLTVVLFVNIVKWVFQTIDAINPL